MGVYRRFGRNDVQQSIIYATPRVILASGSAGPSGSIDGWRGNMGPSSSLSLYEGIRSRRDVKSGDFVVSGISVYPLDPLDTHSIDKVIFVSGSYPSTGSVRMVKVRRAAATNAFAQVTAEDWYQEHFAPIDLLYDYHSRFDSGYFTGSYDYYSLYLNEVLRYAAPGVLYSGSYLPTVSSSFTMEAQVKPTRVTSSFQDFTIQSQKDRWKLFVTGSTGRLAFSDFSTVMTSSAVLQAGVWQHVGAIVGGGSASLYINLRNVGTFAYAGTLPLLTQSYLTVGAEYVVSGTNVVPDNGFSGFIFESRIWDRQLTFAAFSGNQGSTLAASGSAGVLHYSRFNDGPLATAHGFARGSGAFDYGRAGIHGQFVNVHTNLPVGPIWQPNDDQTFVAQRRQINDQIDVFKVLHVPSMFYGRQIATGSVRLVCNAYNNQGIVRVVNDDGRGGLYVSGSIVRSIGSEDYRGVGWNKVGNVFYTEGLIVITDPSLLDFGESGKDWSGTPDLLQVSFDGVYRTPTVVFSCRLSQAQGNASNNPTFSRFDDRGTVEIDDDRFIVKGDEPITYITAVGLYNEERRLVAVAKLAQPIRKREKDKLNIRLRMDF